MKRKTTVYKMRNFQSRDSLDGINRNLGTEEENFN